MSCTVKIGDETFSLDSDKGRLAAREAMNKLGQEYVELGDGRRYWADFGLYSYGANGQALIRADIGGPT